MTPNFAGLTGGSLASLSSMGSLRTPKAKKAPLTVLEAYQAGATTPAAPALEQATASVMPSPMMSNAQVMVGQPRSAPMIVGGPTTNAALAPPPTPVLESPRYTPASAPAPESPEEAQAQAWAQQYGGRRLNPVELVNLKTLYQQHGGGNAGMQAVWNNIRAYAAGGR